MRAGEADLQEKRGGRFKDILVKLGLVSADDMLSYRALALETVPIHIDNVIVPNTGAAFSVEICVNLWLINLIRYQTGLSGP